MRFKYISVIEIVTSLLTLGLAIGLVKTGFGIYSLIYSTMFNALFQNSVFLILGLVKDHNICFHFRLKDTLPFLKIGVFSVGSEVMNYFSREFDIIIISASLGKDSLGLYSLCKKLITAAYSAINPILTKVLTPMLAKIQDDINSVRRIYYDVIETVAFINYPLFILVAIFSYGVLNFLYGVDYIEGRYVLGLLAIYYGTLTTGNPVGSLQSALGRTEKGFYWNICRILLCIIAVFVGSLISLEMVVLCLYLISLISSPLAWIITIKPLIKGKFWDFFFVTFKPFIVSLVIAIPFYMLFSDLSNIYVIILLSMLYLIISLLSFLFLFKNSYVVLKLRNCVNFKDFHSC